MTVHIYLCDHAHIPRSEYIAVINWCMMNIAEKKTYKKPIQLMQMSGLRSKKKKIAKYDIFI